MVKLPEPGEAWAAGRILNERMIAVAGADGTQTVDLADASVNRDTGEIVHNDDPIGLGGVYGDLFLVGEVVAVSADLIEMFIGDMAIGRRDVMSVMVSLYLMGAGHGALMERARWKA